MKKLVKFAAVSVLAIATAAPALTQTALTGVQDLDDRIDAITEGAQEDINRSDPERFGPNAVPQGWRGSLAFSTSVTDGSVNSGDISLAGRLTYGVGNWSHSVGIAGEYGRTGKTVDQQEIFATYQADRYFSDRFYGFGLGRLQYNEFATNQVDGFIGAGPGVRLINNDDVAWRVQAGPGVRYIKDDTGMTTTEASGLVSSRVWVAINETMSLTNDTDVLFSSHSTAATNDLGLNVQMSDSLATRFSIRTDYDSVGATQFEHAAGASVVIGF